MLDHVLPEKGEWDIRKWGRLLLKAGPDYLQYLRHAPEWANVPKLRDAVDGFLEGRLPLRKFDDIVKQYAAIAHYKDGELYPSIAREAYRWNASQFGFQTAVTAMGAVKKADFLPDLCIDGAELVEHFSQPDMLAAFKERYSDTLPKGWTPEWFAKYKLVKLPPDVRNLWLGDYVQCCNKIGGETENVAISSITSAYTANYAIVRKGDPEEIIGKVTAWIGRHKDMPKGQSIIVFNSYQRKNETYDYLFELARYAAEKIVEKKWRFDIPLVEVGYAHLSQTPLPTETDYVLTDNGHPRHPEQKEKLSRDTERLSVMAVRPGWEAGKGKSYWQHHVRMGQQAPELLTREP